MGPLDLEKAQAFAYFSFFSFNGAPPKNSGPNPKSFWLRGGLPWDPHTLPPPWANPRYVPESPGVHLQGTTYLQPAASPRIFECLCGGAGEGEVGAMTSKHTYPSPRFFSGVHLPDKKVRGL